MSSLNRKKIILGITGGIAAYKATLLVRDLVKEGADVQVVMTRSASAFITPLTMQTLSGNPVFHHALLENGQEAAISHIELARWADVVLVAPTTADFMARLATGRADDLLATLCLVTTAPIILAPAMNQQMWLNAATQANATLLISRGIQLWGPDEGEQACGEVGPGRMLEPSQLVQRLHLSMSNGKLHGVRVVMTAGPTREAVDPVRFISNRSSGQMGFSLAESLRDLGAEVTLISGPVSLNSPWGIERLNVESAQDMQQAVMDQISQCDLFVGVAAVADYRPLTMAKNKIKKSGDQMAITLRRNPDILASVAALERAPFTVGFAAETEQLEHFAEKKRAAKKIDLIAANMVGAAKGGFECSENALLLLWQGGQRALPMMPKPQLAQQLAATIAERYHAKNST